MGWIPHAHHVFIQGSKGHRISLAGGAVLLLMVPGYRPSPGRRQNTERCRPHFSRLDKDSTAEADPAQSPTQDNR